MSPLVIYEASHSSAVRSISSPKKQANLLAHHCADISRLSPDPANLLAKRRLRRLDVNEDLAPQFTPAEVFVTMRTLKSPKPTARMISTI